MTTGTPIKWPAATLFRLGFEFQQRESYERAEMFYARAVECDPDHLAAMYNLGVTELRRNRHASAAQRLLILRDRLHPEREPWCDLLFSTTYSLALALKYVRDAKPAATVRTLSSHPPPPQDTSVHPVQLADALAVRLVGELAAGEGVSASPERASFLERLEGPAVMLLAGIVATTFDPVALARNLLRGSESAPTRAELATALLVPKPGDAGAPDAELDERRILACVNYSRSRAMHNVRTRYNVACFLTALGDRLARRADPLAGPILDEAVEQLNLSLADGTLVRWACSDPALRPLKTRRSKDFEAVVNARDFASSARTDTTE